RLDFVRGNSDRNPLGFRWHMDPCPRPTSRVILSDIRMATALYKRTVQTVPLQYLGHDGPHLNKRTRDGPRRTSDNKGGAYRGPSSPDSEVVEPNVLAARSAQGGR